MQFSIVLHEGTDSIKFGMTKEEIQSIIKIKPNILEPIISSHVIEYYPLTCKIFYEPDKNSVLICAEIEFYKPTKVYLDEIQLMDKPESQIADLFKNKFEDYAYETMTGHWSEKYGIGFSTSNAPGTKQLVESVVLSRKGYRQQYKEIYKKAFDEKYSDDKLKVTKYRCLKCNSIIQSEMIITKCPKCIDALVIPTRD